MAWENCKVHKTNILVVGEKTGNGNSDMHYKQPCMEACHNGRSQGRMIDHAVNSIGWDINRMSAWNSLSSAEEVGELDFEGCSW